VSSSYRHTAILGGGERSGCEFGRHAGRTSVADPDRFGPDPDPTSENRPDPDSDSAPDPVKTGSGFI
jgi:hypothetical protein